VGGKNPIHLTKDSPADDIQPAFSPDGERIAFRSERDGGGIFVMGATGESVRRLTDFGYHPAWSPDGKEIVCGTEKIDRPGILYASRIWRVSIEAASGPGARQPLTRTIAAQPHWSPHGHRIAYLGREATQRDLWTVAASGGEPVRVTDDPATDWNPVWSPDGDHLYFSSDRGGSMNLWRLAIDEESGRVRGAPEAVTTPSPFSAFLSISQNGRRLAYVQLHSTANVHTVRFDPAQEAVLGQSEPITQGAREALAAEPSPDGEWLAFRTGGKQEDIFLIRPDGTGPRQLTDDVHRDRMARWSPDGGQIAFFSNRSGRSEIWIIRPDGSGLRQLTGLGCLYPVWSPDGRRLACSPETGPPVLVDAAEPSNQQTPERLPEWADPKVSFRPWSWSKDGRKLAGDLSPSDGSPSGLAIYDVDSRAFDQLTGYGSHPSWLTDSRRLLFRYQGNLHLVDSRSKKAHQVLSAAPHEVVDTFGLSRDNRRIYFSLAVTEADIWMMSLK